MKIGIGLVVLFLLRVEIRRFTVMAPPRPDFVVARAYTITYSMYLYNTIMVLAVHSLTLLMHLLITKQLKSWCVTS